MRPSVVGVDLFGTLVRPPAGKRLLDLLAEAGIYVRPQASRAVAGGFFPAMLVDCRANILSKIIHLSLTRCFSSLHQFIKEAQILTELSQWPTEAEIEACQRAQALALNATTLSPSIADLLERYRSRRIPLVLVSDVSSFWQPLVARLDLGRWFDTQVLSCMTGGLKREGRAWRVAVEAFQLPVESAVLIGDSWRSDGACALTAGTKAILVGRQSRRLAELILRHGASLLLLDEVGAVRVKPQARMALNALAAGLPDEIESDPCSALIIGSDGAIRLRRLAGLTWMPSASQALRLLLRGLEGHEAK